MVQHTMKPRTERVALAGLGLFLYPLFTAVVVFPGNSPRWTVACIAGTIAFLMAFHWFGETSNQAARMINMPPALFGYLVGLILATALVAVGRARK